MILPALGFTVTLILACLNIGRTWTAALAVFFGWLLLVAVTDWRTRALATALDGLLCEALGIRRMVRHKPGEGR